MAYERPSTFCVSQALALKSSGESPTSASMSSVISVSSPARARFFSRVRWDTATSGGAPPIVASVTFV